MFKFFLQTERRLMAFMALTIIRTGRCILFHATSYMLHVTHYMLHVTHYMLQVTDFQIVSEVNVSDE